MKRNVINIDLNTPLRQPVGDDGGMASITFHFKTFFPFNILFFSHFSFMLGCKLWCSFGLFRDYCTNFIPI